MECRCSSEGVRVGWQAGRLAQLDAWHSWHGWHGWHGWQLVHTTLNAEPIDGVAALVACCRTETRLLGWLGWLFGILYTIIIDNIIDHISKYY
jgi:hypothetical protein